MVKSRGLGWLTGRRQQSPPLDLQAFRERVAERIATRIPAAEIDQFGDDGLWVALPGEPGFSLSLGRFHTLYCEAPRDLDRLVDQLAAIPGREPEALIAANLRVLVRPGTYVVSATTPEERQICRHIAGQLWAIVAVDEGDAIGFPSGDVMRNDLGMDNGAIWDRALANTRQEFPEVSIPAEKSLQFFASEHGYVSSCLADDVLWNRLEAETDGGFLVVPVETKVICLVGDFSSAAVPAIEEVCAIARASPDFLSSVPLTRRDGRWIEASEVDPTFAPRRFKH